MNLNSTSHLHHPNHATANEASDLPLALPLHRWRALPHVLPCRQHHLRRRRQRRQQPPAPETKFKTLILRKRRRAFSGAPVRWRRHLAASHSFCQWHGAKRLSTSAMAGRALIYVVVWHGALFGDVGGKGGI